MMPPEDHRPSRSAIIPYYLAGALAFVGVAILCIISAPAFLGHFFQPKLLAITHLAVLGWATMIIFGASNQLAPVITEQRLHSEHIPFIVLVMKLTGVILLVYSFWRFEFSVFTFMAGSLILIAILLHAYNLYRTARKAGNNIVVELMMTAHVWLVLTAAVGLLMLINLRYPFLPEEHLKYLKLHATIGMGGWFIQLVAGVSSRLIPMFLLSRREEKGWLKVSYYCINGSLVLFLLNEMMLQWRWGTYLSVLVMLTGVLYYARYVRTCYITAIRKQMDQGMKQTFLALMLLCIPFLLTLIMLLIKNEVAPHIVTTYGFSFFAGIITVMIMGQTFKTLPFIVWMHITRPDKLPELMPKDLFKEPWVKGQMMIYLPAYFIFLAGIVCKHPLPLYLGASLMTLAATWYSIHVFLIAKKLKTR